MTKYSQANRMMAVSTPLGTDVLLLQQLSGGESLSGLFHFQLELLAESDTEIAFDQLLGQKITVTLSLPDGSNRYFNGIVNKFSEGHRIHSAQGGGTLTRYRAEMVPQLWILTKKVQSRIFQQMNVPAILKQVLAGVDVAYHLQGTYEPRDYCVQYRESDFDFASRLMEEEGIYYFFDHKQSSHQMVVADTPLSHLDVPGPTTVIFEEVEGGTRQEDRVQGWEKTQEIRSGKYRLWDWCFELPGKNLEAVEPILESVQAGTVSHKFHVDGNDKFEIYDYPGGYAQRFDGISPGGGDRVADIQKIFRDNKRTVHIRMQQEATSGLIISGTSTCRQFVAGHKFTLSRHFDGDGVYVLTRVEHFATLGDAYTTGQDSGTPYTNAFECIPGAVPFRPARTTPRPRVEGAQTAVVVGNPGDEIFTDKYARVKVQFPWDREGQKDANSSCWVRVGTPWAGKHWGMVHIPRVGQEVIVAFEEGDPDRPIIVGSVYNAEQMPPYDLPANMTQSGIQSRSSKGGSPENFNEIRFEDKKGEEQLFIHAEKNQDIEVEHDETHWVGQDRKKTIDRDETTHIKRDRTENVDRDESIIIGHNRSEQVKNDESIIIENNRSEEVKNDESIKIDGNRSEEVSKQESITIKESRTTDIGQNERINVKENRDEQVGKNEKVQVGENREVSVGSNDQLGVGKVLVISAGDEISLMTGSASIIMQKNGDITIKGNNITIVGDGKIGAKAGGDMVLKGSKIAAN